MQERSRRQYQSRNRSVPSNQQLSSYQRDQHQMQQHHGNQRSVYHGRPTDLYSSSNYRHPSTTTTTTSTTTSESASQKDQNCSSSICYSYLIAIISSFLVVLGIYLSLTEFNIHFLYISLLGLLIEATSACVYCLSNIQSSRMIRRKQRLNADGFVLNNSNNNQINNNSNNNNNIRENNRSTRQQEIATITDILNNSRNQANHNNELNNATAIHSSTTIDNLEPTAESSAPTPSINPNHGLTSGQSLEEVAGTSSNLTNHNKNTDSNNLVSITIPNDELDRHDQLDSVLSTTSTQDTNSKLLPKSSSCQQSPNETSLGSRSDNNLIDDDGNNNLQSSDIRTTNNNCENRLTQNQNVVSNSSTSGGPSRLENSIIILTQQHDDCGDSTTAAAISSSTNLLEIPENTQMQSSSDLINLNNDSSNTVGVDSSAIGNIDVISEPQSSRRNNTKTQQRSTNMRRTLIMGISGEEEMIEIDEEDLDNMSILPPAYDSIAAVDKQINSDQP